jgi:CubicO group peptidase (beta-lactamase class C family)
MSKNRNRLKTWVVGIVLTVALLLAVVVGVAIYMRATPTLLRWQPQSVPSATQSEPSPQWSEAVARARQIVRAGLAEQNLPGVSVAVGVGDEIVWAEGFGWADVANRVPVTPDTRYKIGTASAVLTSAAVGVLVERGLLKLDDAIQTYVPQFPKKRWPITLRQLMGHIAGVTTDSADERPLFRQRCERPVEALPHFADRELLFEPGTKYEHSNYGWILVSAAIEAAAKQPFLTFMREQIFNPLGMGHTGAESSTEENPDHVGEPSEDFPLFTLIRELILEPLGIGGTKVQSATGLATSYFPSYDADPRRGLHVMLPHNLSCYAGSMAFFSTSSDLVRFGLAMNSGKLLQPATVQLLPTGKPAQAVGQDGELSGGKVVSLMTFRERGIVVAVMSNIAHADTSALALKVAEAFAER